MGFRLVPWAPALAFLLACQASSVSAQTPISPYAPPWPRQSEAAHNGGQVEQAAYTAPLERPSQPAPAAAPVNRQESAIPLAPRGQGSQGETTPVSGGAVLTTFGSLAVVLTLFLAVAWVLRRGAPGVVPALPDEAVEILGRAPLPGRHQMHLLRCGNKLLLVAVSTAGVDTLTEITDPPEVDRLCGLCRQGHPHSSTAAFLGVLQQFGKDAGVGQPRSRTLASRRKRLASEEGDV